MAWAAVLWAGCAGSPPTALYAIDGQRCAAWPAEELARRMAAFDHRTETAALECGLSALRASPDGALRRTATPARACYLLADRLRDEESRERVAAEGLRLADAALADTAEAGRVRYYRAVNRGITVQEHVTRAVRDLPRLALDLEAAVELAPDEDGGGPLRVLGLLYLMAPPWPDGIGDGDKSLALLSRAVREHPEHPLNHLYYARALWSLEEEDEAVGRHLAEARRLIDSDVWGSARTRWQAELAALEAETQS